MEGTENNVKKLRTVKKASQEIGVSRSFFHKLMGKGELKKYKVPGHTSVFISLTEFEALAQATK